jgi:hypothetical protein
MDGEEKRLLPHYTVWLIEYPHAAIFPPCILKIESLPQNSLSSISCQKGVGDQKYFCGRTLKNNSKISIQISYVAFLDLKSRIR